MVRAAWSTSASELAGTYHADGAWGSSTLILNPDHSFQQSVSFTNQFNGRPDGRKTATGQWIQKRRTTFSEAIELSSFINLSPGKNQSVVPNHEISYGALGLGFGIEIDPGAGIYYWKN